MFHSLTQIKSSKAHHNPLLTPEGSRMLIPNSRLLTLQFLFQIRQVLIHHYHVLKQIWVGMALALVHLKEASELAQVATAVQCN